MIKQRQEDYLRTLYHLQEENKEIRSKDIVTYLKVTKPSVSAMLKKFVHLGFIKMSPYSKIVLTKKGEIKAKEITQRHRLVEVFLKRALGIKKENIHQEAHELEHAFSPKTIDKLDKFLNRPKVCPHGKKIPK